MAYTNISDTSCAISIIIDKPAPHHDDLACLSYENTYEAMANLSPAAFTLYMYFVLHDDKQSYQLSSTCFCEMTGLTYDMFVSAYNELIAGAYLTIRERNADTLYFHDIALEPPFLYQTITSNQRVWDDDEVW